MTDEEWFARLKVEHPIFYELMMNTKKKHPVFFGQMMADIHRVNNWRVECVDQKTINKVYKDLKNDPSQIEMEFQL